MFELRYLQPLRHLSRIFTADRSPHQLAAGIALGMLIGFLPKGNLLAVAATVLFFSLRVNLGTGLSTAFVVSLISPGLDRLTHGVGVHLLRMPAIYRTIRSGYDLPLFPWTDLNNTVVIGNLVLGLVLIYPAYRISHLIIKLVSPHLDRYRQRFRYGTRNLDASL